MGLSKQELKKAVLHAKRNHISDAAIGGKFGITFRQLEKIITEEMGVNISSLRPPKKIKTWAPPDFSEESTSVWSFRQRGNWATHEGKYRGNWSPYIPRNVILKYSKPGDLVLDYFVGSGTTAVEAKLLGRKCIAMDINPAAVELTRQNLDFQAPATLLEGRQVYEPELKVGDARVLKGIRDESIDLICTHPPYAGIIQYSSHLDGDLSKYELKHFLSEMGKVAEESYRVLKPSGYCAILIGDTRKQKHVIPMGFHVIDVFLKTGFVLKELVIKRQHNCKTTGFWYIKSIQYNFLLLAHEYLPIFKKLAPTNSSSLLNTNIQCGDLNFAPTKPDTGLKLDQIESTTVWIFPEKEFDQKINQNVIARYSQTKRFTLIDFISATEWKEKVSAPRPDLFFIKIRCPTSDLANQELKASLKKIVELIDVKIASISYPGYLVLQASDFRKNGHIVPFAKLLLDSILSKKLWLKEIVVLTSEACKLDKQPEHGLKISHEYLLVYEVKNE